MKTIVEGMSTPLYSEVFTYWLFRYRGWRARGPNIDASKCVLTCEPHRGDGVERHRYPHAIQFRVLQGDMNIFDPKGGAFGWDSFNSADMESARVDPDLPP